MSDEENEATEENAAAEGEADSPEAVATADNPDDAASPETAKADDGATTPEFQELEPKPAPAVGGIELNRFGSVQVVLTAELGRTEVTLQELMGLSEGAVLELDREIGAPVELIAQGVPMGNGEVVVIEDRFAIRIKQLYQNT